jgi:hypothetical protein
MEYQAVARQSEAGRHIILKPHPQPHKPVGAVQVADGSAAWGLIIVAAVAIGWAITKRFAVKDSTKRSVCAE